MFNKLISQKAFLNTHTNIHIHTHNFCYGQVKFFKNVEVNFTWELHEINRFFFLLNKSLADTHVLFWGHWYPCFGFLAMSPLGFKARVGFCLIHWECNVHFPRSTSGANLLTSWFLIFYKHYVFQICHLCIIFYV